MSPPDSPPNSPPLNVLPLPPALLRAPNFDSSLHVVYLHHRYGGIPLPISEPDFVAVMKFLEGAREPPHFAPGLRTQARINAAIAFAETVKDMLHDFDENVKPVDPGELKAGTKNSPDNVKPVLNLKLENNRLRRTLEELERRILAVERRCSKQEEGELHTTPSPLESEILAPQPVRGAFLHTTSVSHSRSLSQATVLCPPGHPFFPNSPRRPSSAGHLEHPFSMGSTSSVNKMGRPDERRRAHTYPVTGMDSQSEDSPPSLDAHSPTLPPEDAVDKVPSIPSQNDSSIDIVLHASPEKNKCKDSLESHEEDDTAGDELTAGSKTPQGISALEAFAQLGSHPSRVPRLVQVRCNGCDKINFADCRTCQDNYNNAAEIAAMHRDIKRNIERLAAVNSSTAERFMEKYSPLIHRKFELWDLLRPQCLASYIASLKAFERETADAVLRSSHVNDKPTRPPKARPKGIGVKSASSPTLQKREKIQSPWRNLSGSSSSILAQDLELASVGLV